MMLPMVQNHSGMLLGCGCLLFWNFLIFCVIGFDKFRARHNMRRLPERTIRCFAMCGGGIGILAAFYLFSHKTKHLALLVWVWGFTIVELLAMLVAAYIL